MKKLITVSLLAAAGMMTAGFAQADEALAKAKNCMSCHNVDKKVVGPAYKEVAKKYAGQAGADKKLAETVVKGGKGNWGAVPMPPNKVTPEEADKRVARVFCTLYYSLEDYTSPGMYYEHDTRGNLKRFDKQFRQDHNGLHLRVGLEPEMLWLKPKAGEVRPYEGITEAFAYHIGQFESAREVWKQQGRSEKWIAQRMTGQETRNKLTDYWASHDIKPGTEFAILTNLIHQEWTGVSVKAHKAMKGLKEHNLRDHMSEAELIFTALAELSTRQIAEAEAATGMAENSRAAKQGGTIAKQVRNALEAKTGKPVVSGENFLPTDTVKTLKKGRKA